MPRALRGGDGICFCKKFILWSAQAGADERGFRDVAPSEALTAGLDAAGGMYAISSVVGSLSSPAECC